MEQFASFAKFQDKEIVLKTHKADKVSIYADALAY